MSKYHSKSVRDEDGFFASKAEHKRWQELRMLERGNAITGLVRQPRFPLWTVDLQGHRVPVLIDGRKTSYVADFAYHEDGRYVVEDVKSKATLLPLSKLKMAIVKASLGIDVQVVMIK